MNVKKGEGKKSTLQQVVESSLLSRFKAALLARHVVATEYHARVIVETLEKVLKEDRTDLKATGELLPLPEERVEDKPEFFQYDVQEKMAGHVGKDTQSSFFMRLADVETKLSGLQFQCDVLSEHKANTDNVPEWSQHIEERLAKLEGPPIVKKAREQLKNLDLKRPLDEIEAVLLDRVVKLDGQARQFENVIANGRTDFEEFEKKLIELKDKHRNLAEGALARLAKLEDRLPDAQSIIQQVRELQDQMRTLTGAEGGTYSLAAGIAERVDKLEEITTKLVDKLRQGGTCEHGVGPGQHCSECFDLDMYGR